MNVHWTTEAILDIDEAFGLGSDKAIGFYNRVDQIAVFPLSGRKVPELDNPTIRELIHLKHRIVYLVGTGELHILAVFHSRRDLSNTRLKRYSD